MTEGLMRMLEGVADALTGKSNVVRRPGSRSSLEILRVKVAVTTAAATGLFLLVGIAILIVHPWSTPEPPLALALTMTLGPVGMLAATYAAFRSVAHARSRGDVLTDSEIAAMPLALADAWIQGSDAVRAIEATDGCDSVRGREAAEIRWAMVEHVKAVAPLRARLHAAPIENERTAMQDLADWLTALAATAVTKNAS